MRNKNVFSFGLVFFLYFRMCLSYYGKTKSWDEKYERNICPKLYPKNFVNFTPVGNFTAGNYTEKTELKGLRQCVMECCMSLSCNVALLVEERCYHIECVSNELCLPLQRSTERKLEMQVSMILVKPVLPNENWLDILDSTNKDVSTNEMPEEEVIYSPYQRQQQQIPTNEDEENFLSQFLTNLPNMEDESTRNYLKYRDNDGDIVDASLFLEKVPCMVGAGDDCPIDSECIPLTLKSLRGICKCVLGTEQNNRGACVPTIRPFAKGPTNIDLMLKNSDDKSDSMKYSLNAPVSIVNLKVSVLSKEVRLPENEVSLVAYTVPDENATNSHYNYVWTLADQPKEGFTGNMKQNGPTVTLSELTEGQYRFKVTVNGTNSYGEAFANVTVLPPHRINKPPQVDIMPQMQTVKLPNTKAVLDGSGSTDDDQIISYHWELVSGPIGYQPPLQDGPTLELQDLKQAGNYTFKLTVEDSDHAINSTMASITVLNHTDYPPEANAGQNVIIYLPNNSLTLNGSLSTDDHEIVSWEWTKAAEDENKAVDMQNTHSPYLQLSNLSEGVYRFVLKVTDSSGQWSTADVRVFVKPPTNTPPIADAGSDMFISLPQTWVVLNGSNSHDDHRIVAWSWLSALGPTNATILNFNHSVANATGLTKGTYVFTLKVVDDNGNVAMDNVTVTVTQNKNSPPKADGGGDQVLTLPVPVLILNGSKSSDDFRVVSWKWTRVPSGLAAGTIVLNSDVQPVLMLTNIEAGRYVFELTVTDDQGESSRDTVSVQVKPNPLEDSLIELTLNVPIDTFTQSQLDSLLQKISLLVKDDIKVNVTELRGEIDTGNTKIIFFLSKQGTALGGLEALSSLEPSVWAAWSGRARTVRCLSSCSGRGSCSQATRACRCDPLWMQSLWPSDPAQPDCAWSVVYFGVGALCVLAAFCALVSALSRACRRKRAAAAPPVYRLLPTGDSQSLQLTNKNQSDTDTDSDDVLFETKTKTSSFTRQPNGQNAKSSKKNGYKRRVRT